jgi:hypothetical protein
LIVKIKQGCDIKYQVSKVDKTKVVNGKPVTRFAIKDKVRSTDNEYITYWVTVFDDLNIENGDFVKLLDFDNIVASYYATKKKINFFIAAIVEVVKKEDAENDRPFVNPYE